MKTQCGDPNCQVCQLQQWTLAGAQQSQQPQTVSQSRPEPYGGVADLIPGTLRGYRGWRLPRLEETRLRAVSYEANWQPGVNHARCMKMAMGFYGLTFEHSPPERSCTCGFYAKYAYEGEEIMQASVRGVVKASGRIILGLEGFRAEKAEIEALYLDKVFNSPNTRQMLDQYNVPVYRRLEKMMADFPPADMGGLIGPARAEAARLEQEQRRQEQEQRRQKVEQQRQAIQILGEQLREMTLTMQGLAKFIAADGTEIVMPVKDWMIATAQVQAPKEET